MTYISDDAYVSQYVSRESGEPDLRCRPRPQDTDGVSVFLGIMSAGTVCFNVRGKIKGQNPDETDGVRRARVGDLRERGFQVVRTPNPRKPLHASVQYVGTWDEAVDSAFEACFGDVVWYGDEDPAAEAERVGAGEVDDEDSA